MPTIQPAELWQESGRYDAYGKEMLRIKDRHDRDLLYGPTHEEVITDIFRKNVTSYKDLPKNLYQIHWKFRDEIRPRFGVMRGREFVMKDAYSFHTSYEDLQATYREMYDCYSRIFTRLGLKFRAVAADTGSIGGTGSQAPDAATIPASALKNVVVTRDGAGAQYGSDAIAGVVKAN